MEFIEAGKQVYRHAEDSSIFAVFWGQELLGMMSKSLTFIKIRMGLVRATSCNSHEEHKLTLGIHKLGVLESHFAYVVVTCLCTLSS